MLEIIKVPKPGSSLNDIAKVHFSWVEIVGWHKDKRPLEYIALIASEIGEAANECRGLKPTEHFGEELADIILRTLDTALVHRIDIEHEILEKIKLNLMRGTRGRLK